MGLVWIRFEEEMGACFLLVCFGVGGVGVGSWDLGSLKKALSWCFFGFEKGCGLVERSLQWPGYMSVHYPSWATRCTFEQLSVLVL